MKKDGWFRNLTPEQKASFMCELFCRRKSPEERRKEFELWLKVFKDLETDKDTQNPK